MTTLHDLFDTLLFEELLADGYVRLQTHPDFPTLAIANYTEKAACERVWNEVTKNTRGLIFNVETWEVIARPFSKLYNWDETESPKILDWNAPVFSWSNKFDGSLGIVYRNPAGELAVATRGSFASDQAIHATELLLTDTALIEEVTALLDAGYTPLYEIIYPENRIVLSYGGDDKLVPLGAIHIHTGEYMPHHSFDTTVRSFHSLLQDLSRQGAEGWVVWVSPLKGVKVKQADYIALHRIVTGLSRKSVWRTLVAGTFREYVAQLPDELFKWAEEVASELLVAKNELLFKVGDYKTELHEQGFTTRKDQAGWVIANVPVEFRGPVFQLLDDKPVDDWAWEQVEPFGAEKV